jgi:hypothetical protein
VKKPVSGQKTFFRGGDEVNDDSRGTVRQWEEVLVWVWFGNVKAKMGRRFSGAGL